MEITSNLNKSQFNEVRMLYADFFRSINFNNIYTESMINSFSYRKAKNVFEHGKLSQYFFAIEDDEIVGLIHGKIIDNVGLVSHVYVKEAYRKKRVLSKLYKSLITWFKDKNISTLEIEVNKDNRIYKNLERNNWQMVRDLMMPVYSLESYEWINSC